MKQHLDFLYEQKNKTQSQIDKLKEKLTHPRDAACAECPCPVRSELKATEVSLHIIDDIIVNFIKQNFC
jgi:hypothetical protein